MGGVPDGAFAPAAGVSDLAQEPQLPPPMGGGPDFYHSLARQRRCPSLHQMHHFPQPGGRGSGQCPAITYWRCGLGHSPRTCCKGGRALDAHRRRVLEHHQRPPAASADTISTPVIDARLSTLCAEQRRALAHPPRLSTVRGGAPSTPTGSDRWHILNTYQW